MDELTTVADRLYAVPADAFTAARNEAAKEAKAAGDKELAGRIGSLRKPSVAAWSVNLLVRRESEQIEGALSLAEQLRAAAEALDGDELRALTRQRRALTSALASTARALARDVGVRLTAAVADQVEGILTAAMLDPVAAQVVRTGRLVTAFTSTGVSDLDVVAVVAVPDAVDVPATPVTVETGDDDRDDPDGRPAGLHVVPDGGARLAAAEDELAEADAEVDAAARELAEVERSAEKLNARRLQLQGEADELKRRLAAIEDDVDQVDEDLEEAEDALSDAEVVLAEARRTRTDAAAEVSRLGGEPGAGS